MRRLICCVLLLLCTILILPQVKAQHSNTNFRPFLVPFQVDGDWGLMDTLGREVKTPGFYKSIAVHGDFSYYIIGDQSETPKYWMMDSRSGDRIDLGNLMSSHPVLKMGEVRFYHFEKNNKSVLASPATMESFTLDRLYKKMEAIHLYDLKGENKKSYLLAYDDNNIGRILSVENHFKKVAKVPPFEKIDLIGGRVKKDYYIKTFLVGFAAAKMEKGKEASRAKDKISKSTKPAINASPAEVRKGKSLSKIQKPAMITPPSPVHFEWMDQDDSKPDSSEIYDYRLADKGAALVNDSALSAVFGTKVVLEKNRPVSIAMGGGVISGTGGDHSVELNQEFAIQRITKKVTKVVYRQDYYLVHKKDDQTYTELLSDNEALFSWAKHKGNRLLSIRLGKGKKRLNAFFDYNGVALPKNRLMVPRKYYQGETMKSYLFQ